MRYTISDENADSVSLETNPQNVILIINDDVSFIFTLDEFKDFRKAVGYVWQEVHDD